jgi:transcriptional regulator with XRE-family HTH domain
MKLGDVLRKERERKRLAVEKVAAELNVPVDDYQELEAGSSPIEQWAPKLAQIAIQLSTPTSRLISETGKSRDASECGRLIRAHREKRALDQEQFAKSLGWQVSELDSIETGKSPLESYAPMLLRFSELIEQPIFNLFYPCGLPLNQLEDYP